MRPLSSKVSAYSLLEVIVAVAIFSVAVTAMLGLLPALSRQSAASLDTLNALRLPDALRVELQRLATVGGFDALAEETKSLIAPLPDTCVLVATRDATQLHSLDYQPPLAVDRIPASAQYFLIEAWKFSDAPLAFESSGAVLALHLRVSWPYRLPGSLTVTPLAARERVSFNLVLTR